ncbi:ABC transporter permease [Myxococcota bacterium]|nr:ABC transporter permease [Myxococcota bacterium]
MSQETFAKEPVDGGPALGSGFVGITGPDAAAPELQDALAASPATRDPAKLQLGPPLLVLVGVLVIWWLLAAYVFEPIVFPSPLAVFEGFQELVASGEIFVDIATSLFRVGSGFLLAAGLGIPTGIVLGHSLFAREAFLPLINFLRNLSPLSWIPFAILWFGIGHVPSIFLIFMATFFPITLAAMAAVSSVPQVYFRVASEYGFSGVERLNKVTLPAIMPSLITGLRVAAGVSWVVVVAAEMLAGRSGLGFLIWDARNGLRLDLLVCGMITIGCVGVVIDLGLLQLTKMKSVRWGYER